MKLAIALAATAFLLGGCLESSETKPDNVLKVETEEFVDGPGPGPGPGPVETASVADMLVNTQNRAGDYQDYWDCAVVGEDDDLFSVVFADNGDGVFETSEGAGALSWSEATNGVLSVDIIETGDSIEWTNFDFTGLFEFTADLYQDGRLVETDSCVLTDVPEGGEDVTGVSESYFVTAQGPSSEGEEEPIWQCDFGGESIFFFFYADNTGVIGFTANNEDGVPEFQARFLADWNFADGSLETFVTSDTGRLVELVSLNAISTTDASSFTTGNVLISNEDYGDAFCTKY